MPLMPSSSDALPVFVTRKRRDAFDGRNSSYADIQGLSRGEAGRRFVGKRDAHARISRTMHSQTSKVVWLGPPPDVFPKESGDPNVRQLEPDRRLAERIQALQTAA